MPIREMISRPMSARDPAEIHRAATPLELLFDLVSVIAIASAAHGLQHAITEHHFVDGLIGFFITFFSIWWAWMNYTWFATAYDNDSVTFRILTMVIMGGALVLASGIDAMFSREGIGVVVGGYVIMRLALCALWLNAAAADPKRRKTCLRYAIGIALAQVYWVSIALFGEPDASYFIGLMVLGFAMELTVPVIAEKADITPWHRHHIIERYGLLTIIVLGEILLASSIALEDAFSQGFNAQLVYLSISALVITFAMWWIYFAEEEHLEENTLSRALVWGYGHLLIFAAGAAVGAGFGVMVSVLSGSAHIGVQIGTMAVAIPLALFFFGLWFARDRFALGSWGRWLLPVSGLLIIAVGLAIPSVETIAIIAAVTAGLRSFATHRCEIA